MTVQRPLLTRRAVVQAAIETDYGVAPTIGLNDGVLCSEPQYTIDPNILERDFVRDSLSTTPIIIGRKLAGMTFSTEMRGNGKQLSGLAADAPVIARLFQACGYGLKEHTTPNVFGPFDVDAHNVPVAWTANPTAASNTDTYCYHVTVVTAGASGVAAVSVTSDILSENSVAPIVLTSGTEVDIGNQGLTMTPTFSGDLEVGQQWVIWLRPTGVALDPISDDFQSITLVMYRDGIKHTMTGSFGTFTIEATAGDYARISWTFTGKYEKPIDENMPSPNYEKTLPTQVELARLRIDGYYAIVEQFTFDQGNDIQLRPDVSSTEGYIGSRIVARDPTGGINPEAEKVADQDFWDKFALAKPMPFQMRIGTKPGNTVFMTCPGVQYTGMSYTDRNGLMTFDAGLKFPAYRSNDEISFFFC